MFYFALKLNYLGELPAVVFAMGHHEKAKAHAAYNKVIQSESRHPRILRLKAEPLRSEAQAWHEDFEGFHSCTDLIRMRKMKCFVTELILALHNSRC